MARGLRDALKGSAVETTHGESLELIAKTFGYDNWNILSAKIEAARPRAIDTGASPATAREAKLPEALLCCSFCGKNQHQVRTHNFGRRHVVRPLGRWHKLQSPLCVTDVRCDVRFGRKADTKKL